MKLQANNTAVVDIHLNKLSDGEKRRFENILLKNDVKFNFDIQRQQYVALLQIEKDVQPMQKSKSVTFLRPKGPPKVPTAITQKNFHQDCGDTFLEPRPFIPQRTQIQKEKFKETAPARSDKLKSRSPNLVRAKSVINVRDGAVVVKTRLEVLERYQHCFPQLNFSKILFTPVHISKPFLMRKIEFFYNKQFDAIQRYKTPQAVNLPKVIYDFLLNKYKDTPNYYLQSLVNLLYSVDRHHEEPEIDLFQQFLTEPIGSERLLFYLYLRQVFKILTSNFFLNHTANEADPSKLRLTKDQAITIIEQACYNLDTIRDQLLNGLALALNTRTSIGYYKFLVAMMKVDIDYRVRSSGNRSYDSLLRALH